MTAGDASFNTANHTSLSELLKVKYGEAIPHLLPQFAPFLGRLKKRKGAWTKKFGGRQFEFPYEVKRAENAGVRGQGQWLPGFSGNTRDDIDTIQAETAVVDRARIYSAASFDGLWVQGPNKEYQFKPGSDFALHLTYALEDLAREMQMQLFGDQTGYLGTVDSVSTVTVNLKPVTTVDARGALGTQRIRPNMKIMAIQEAHWASSPTVSQADSTIGIIKVSSTSDVCDTSATPSFVASTDVAAAGLAAGDVLVSYGSRTWTANGSASGATLYCLQGLLQMVDDGTIAANLYGLSRSSFPVLKAKTNLSATSRKFTQKMAQTMSSNLFRRNGPEKMDSHILLSELSIRDGFVPDEGASLKRYIQEDKALNLIAGFSDVMFAFLDNNRPIPWVCDRDFPYGHAMLLGLNDLEAMWDKEPGVMDYDGQTIRNIDGKDEFYVMFSGYGQFIKKMPWQDGRWSGLEGSF